MPIESVVRQRKAGLRDHRCDFLQLREGHRLVIGRAAVAGKAHKLQRMPAEQAADESRPYPQRLHTVHRHDEIGPRHQSASPSQALVGPFKPEIPFAHHSPDHTRHHADEQERADREQTADHLRKKTESCQPLSRTGQLFAPGSPVPDFERQQEVDLTCEAADNGHDRKRELEQAEGDDAPG